MALVRSPNSPANGETRWKLDATCQSTRARQHGGQSGEQGQQAEATAIGTASRVTQRTPPRLTSVNMHHQPDRQRRRPGTSGRYHCVIAEAERIAVRPQVGTQPHQ